MEGREKYGDAYLITGNISDFPLKVFVVTPREMLEIMDNNEDPFYSDKNMEQISKADQQVQDGEVVTKTMDELESME